MESELATFMAKCRCCLENVKGDTYVKITKLIEERFLEFTSTSLNTLDGLSTKICLTCNSLLARHSAMKKTFIENQEKLNKLLKRPYQDPAIPYFIDLKDDDDEPYTVTESSEPLENVAPQSKCLEGLTIEEIIPKRSRTSAKGKAKDKKSPPELKNSDPNVSQPSVSKKFCCDKCDYKVLKRVWLLNHQWKVHDGPMPLHQRFICEICTKQFNKAEYLKRHLDRHNNVERFICDHCDFRTPARTDMTNHLLTHLSNDPRVTFRCDFQGCNVQLRSKPALLNHKKAFHLNDKPFACNFCSKTFVRRFTLRYHIRFVHQKERPFPCDFEGCDQSFVSKSQLSRHNRNIHLRK